MTRERWLQLMKGFGINNNLDTWQSLVEAYAEKHRHYHTSEHIEAALRHFDSVQQDVEKTLEMELALWFHDAIYEPFSSTNEFDSAKWVRNFLKQNNVSKDRIQVVQDLIMATRHDAGNLNGDRALIVDIDLGILGAEENVYEIFEQNIRKEYSKVPSFIFKRKRKALLKSFLQRDYIFQHPYFFQTFESRARDNLSKTIAKL